MTTTTPTTTTGTTSTLPSVFTYTSTQPSTSSAGAASGLDINGLVTKLMSVEEIPLNNLASQYTATEAKLTAEGTVQSALASLQTAVQTLGDTAKYNSLKATAADPSILSATTSSIAKAGTYSVEVTSVAQAQKLTSTGVADASAKVGDGTLTIDIGSYDGTTYTPDPTKQVTIQINSTNDSLSGIRDAINASGAGVSASILNDGTNYRLVLTSSNSGTASTMRIGVTGDAALSNQLAYDPVGTQKMSQSVKPTDAVFTIDGVTVTKSSNIVSDVIPGVTLNLLGMSAPNTPTTLTVATDGSGFQSALQGLVTAYNNLQSTITSVGGYDLSTKIAGPLFGDSTLRAIQDNVVQQLETLVPNSAGSSVRSLSDLGVSFQVDGTLALDTTKLQSTLADPNADFSALLGPGGMPDTLNNSLITILGSTGAIANSTNAFNDQITNLENQAQTWQTRLSQIESNYRAQYNALDALVGSMQQTSTYLTQQLASLTTSTSSTKSSG